MNKIIYSNDLSRIDPEKYNNPILESDYFYIPMSERVDYVKEICKWDNIIITNDYCFIRLLELFSEVEIFHYDEDKTFKNFASLEPNPTNHLFGFIFEETINHLLPQSLPDIIDAEVNEMKMKVTVVAEFEIPDGVVLHDSVFEAEGVFFHPEISFDCIEAVDGEDPLRFPNDIVSIEQYEIKNLSMESLVERIED